MQVMVYSTFKNPRWRNKIGEVVEVTPQEGASTMYTVEIEGEQLLFFENEVSILG
jgi:hypothetical protein